jgi:hypothetical protein
MTTEQAREIRSVLADILAPLDAARLGTVPRHIAIEMAVGRLRALDERLRAVESGQTTGKAA